MIPVLDHGYVDLKSYMAGDIDVVQAARQSYDQAWRAGENEGSDARLICYLMRERHSIPFEQCVFRFQVKLPIFVERQWRKHRTWSYCAVSEVSGRYRKLSADFYVPLPQDIGTQSTTNKQGRTHSIEVDLAQRQREVNAYLARCNANVREYEWLLEQGWPRELARCVLPLSMYITQTMRVDLWNLLHFLDLRTHEHAQFEIRAYANAITQLIDPIVPVAMAAWRETHSV